MRMIDNFRTPVERGMIEALERIVMGTVTDIGYAMGYKDPSNQVIRHHTKSLLEEDIIRICGYAGGRRRPVYVLADRRVRND